MADLQRCLTELLQDSSGRRNFSAPPKSSLEPEPHANNPPLYDGDPNACRVFLCQCVLVFALQPRRYATEETRVAHVLTLLNTRQRLRLSPPSWWVQETGPPTSTTPAAAQELEPMQLGRSRLTPAQKQE